MTKFAIFKSAEQVSIVDVATIQDAAKAAGLTNPTFRAVRGEDVAHQWFVDGDRSFAVEVIEYRA